MAKTLRLINCRFIIIIIIIIIKRCFLFTTHHHRSLFISPYVK